MGRTGSRSLIATCACILAALVPLRSAWASRGMPPEARCDSTHALRVLFVGNSFTYVQNMPWLVEAIAASLPGPCVHIAMIAEGGATLEDHWSADSVIRRIRSGGWTHVVLNDQSSFGEGWFLEGSPRVGSSGAELLKFSVQFADSIRAARAKPVLLAHWSDDGAPDRDQHALDQAFAAAARASGSTLSPAGRAIKQMRASLPETTPYFEDGHHLSSAGAYLEALVTYGVLTGRSPVGAASRLSGAPVELNRGIVFADSVVTLVDLPATTALAIQKIAENALAESRAHGLVVPEVPPLSTEFPRLAEGKGIPSRDSLLGHWTGTSTVLPTGSHGPVSVELFVSGGPGQADSAVVRLPEMNVRVRGPTRFAGRAEVGFKGGVVVIHAAAAPNDGVIEFRGTLDSGVLSGVAELHILGPGMRSFNSVGRFEVRRVP